MDEIKKNEVSGKNHQAKIRPDKCLLSEEIRSMFLTCFEIQGHQHECKDVIYFPEEIFREKVFDKFVFFVPVARVDSEEKHPTPVFMLEFSVEQKVELIACAKEKGLRLFENYFWKPKISISYDQREEEAFEDELAGNHYRQSDNVYHSDNDSD